MSRRRYAPPIFATLRIRWRAKADSLTRHPIEPRICPSASMKHCAFRACSRSCLPVELLTLAGAQVPRRTEHSAFRLHLRLILDVNFYTHYHGRFVNAYIHGYIAQWLERLTADQQVPGSNPGVPFRIVSPNRVVLGQAFSAEATARHHLRWRPTTK